MAGPVACAASRRAPSYRESGLPRQRRPFTSLAGIVLLSLSMGGCGLYGSFGSLFGSESRPAAAEITGSIRPVAARTDEAQVRTDGLPPEADLAFAKAAAVEVLTRGGKDVSVPWENPSSGARGTVTPISVAYQAAGATCRDFLASHLASNHAPAWMQGEACRDGSGRWQVRTLRPWSRT